MPTYSPYVAAPSGPSRTEGGFAPDTAHVARTVSGFEQTPGSAAAAVTKTYIKADLDLNATVDVSGTATLTTGLIKTLAEYRALVNSTTPALFWDFQQDGTGTTVLDRSGNGRDGTLAGDAIWHETGQESYSNYSIVSQANTGGVTRTQTLDFSAGNCSVLFTFKMDTLVDWGATFNTNTIASITSWTGIQITVAANGQIFAGSHVTTRLATLAGTVQANKWYTVLYRRNSTGRADLWVNGVLATTATGITAPPASTSVVTVSHYPNIAPASHLQSTAVWTRELTTDEARSLTNVDLQFTNYSTPMIADGSVDHDVSVSGTVTLRSGWITPETYRSDIEATSPALFWYFDEGTGTVVTDHSGNSRDGSIAGTTSWLTGLTPATAGGTDWDALRFTAGGNGTVSRTEARDVTTTFPGFSFLITVRPGSALWSYIFQFYMGVDQWSTFCMHGGNNVLYAGTGAQRFGISNVWTANTWVTFLYTQAATTGTTSMARIYRNGVLQQEQAAMPRPTLNQTQFMLAYYNVSGGQTVDFQNLSLWYRELSPQEIYSISGRQIGLWADSVTDVQAPVSIPDAALRSPSVNSRDVPPTSVIVSDVTTNSVGTTDTISFRSQFPNTMNNRGIGFIYEKNATAGPYPSASEIADYLYTAVTGMSTNIESVLAGRWSNLAYYPAGAYTVSLTNGGVGNPDLWSLSVGRPAGAKQDRPPIAVVMNAGNPNITGWQSPLTGGPGMVFAWNFYLTVIPTAIEGTIDAEVSIPAATLDTTQEGDPLAGTVDAEVTLQATASMLTHLPLQTTVDAEVTVEATCQLVDILPIQGTISAEVALEGSPWLVTILQIASSDLQTDVQLSAEPSLAGILYIDGGVDVVVDPQATPQLITILYGDGTVSAVVDLQATPQLITILFAQGSTDAVVGLQATPRLAIIDMADGSISAELAVSGNPTLATILPTFSSDLALDVAVQATCTLVTILPIQGTVSAEVAVTAQGDLIPILPCQGTVSAEVAVQATATTPVAVAAQSTVTLEVSIPNPLLFMTWRLASSVAAEVTVGETGFVAAIVPAIEGTGGIKCRSGFRKALWHRTRGGDIELPFGPMNT